MFCLCVPFLCVSCAVSTVSENEEEDVNIHLTNVVMHVFSRHKCLCDLSIFTWRACAA